MPYYQWRGVDLKGRTRSGKLVARSDKELESSLFKKDIALLSHAPVRVLLPLSSVGQARIVQFFRQLAILVRAGVLLPEALEICSDQADHVALKEILYQVSGSVHEGGIMSGVLAQYPHIFDLLMIESIRVGERSGRLADALENLCAYLEAQQEFKKKLRNAALGPLLTLGFFFCITLVVFLVIIPRFSDIFASVGQELPSITKAMLAISSFLRSWLVLVVGVAAIAAFLVFNYFAKRSCIKNGIDAFWLRIPIINALIKHSSLTYFLRAASMLVGSGMHLVQALAIAKKSVHNTALQQQFDAVQEDVESGYSLSQAMVNQGDDLFSSELIALIKVGEESGNLGTLLGKAAVVYQDKVNGTLVFLTTMMQPLLMIVLGLLITALIFAVYMPIFSLSGRL